MKKFTKTLFVMLVALLGFQTNVAADELVLNPSVTTVIKGSGNDSKEAQYLNTNGDNNYYDAEATFWLCSQANISGGKLNNQNAAYGGSYAVITKFDASSQLAGMTITKATLKFRSVCNVSGKNSNVITSWLPSTDWDATTVTWNSLDKAVNQISAGSGQNVNTTAKYLTEDVTDLLEADEDKVVAFAIYTYTAREQKISEIQLIVEAVDASASANVTLKYVDGSGNELKSETIVASSGTTYTLSDAQKAAFFANDMKYFYESDNSAEVTVAGDGSSVITIVCREAALYNYTLNSNLGVVTQGTGFEGETVAIGYPRYALAEGVFYEAPKTNESKKQYRIDIALTADNASASITYTAKDGVNTVFFAEAENIEGATLSVANNIPVRASNAQGATTEEAVTITTLPAGKYKFHAGVFTSKASGYSDLNVNIGIGGETFTAVLTGVNLSEIPSEEYTLNVDTDIKFLGQTADTQFDYIWIEKTGDVEVPTKSIFLKPGLWNADGARYAAYVWNSNGTKWYNLAAAEEDGVYTVAIPEPYTGLILARMNGETVENNWDNKWNQTADINFAEVADSTLFTITDWSAYEASKYVKAETPVEPETIDCTNLIKNPAYLENGYEGWTYTENGFKTRSYEAPMNLITYNGNAAFEVSQTLENVPTGLYKLSVHAFYRAGSLDDEKTKIAAGTELEKELTMYATVSDDKYSKKVMNLSEGATDVAYGDGTTQLANNKYVPNSANESRAWYIAGEYKNEVLFNVFEAGNVTIGLSKTVGLPSDYCPIGAWTLTRMGDADAEAATPDAKPVAIETMAIVGDFTGGWPTDEDWSMAKAMTQDTENAAVWTLSVENFEAEAKKYEYKATANGKWGDYELPNEGNQEFVFGTEEYPAGKYNLTFTANTNEHMLTLAVNKVEEVNPNDYTNKIVNPSFETGDLTGWTVGSSSDTGVKPNSNGTYHTEGCDGDYLFNTWWQGIPITQTVAELPNGKYELKALMTNDAITAGNKPCLYLLANGEHSEPFSSPNAGTFAEGSMQFYVTNGTATIGAVGGNADGTFNEGGYYWYKVDNFRLTFIEALPDIADIEIPEGKMSNAAASAITTAKEAGDVVALLNAVKAAKESIAAYAKVKATLDELDGIVENTNVYTTAAKETFDVAMTTAKTGYEEGTMSDADAKAFNYGSRLEGLLPSLLLSAYTSTVEGTPYINTWSIEGNNDGSNFKTPFYEYWVGDGESLATNAIVAEMTGLEAGKYDVTAWVRVRIKNGVDAPATGITLQANEGEAVAIEGDQIGESRLYAKEYTAKATVGEDGKLTIKFNVADGTNVSWLSFKNVKFTKLNTYTATFTTDYDWTEVYAYVWSGEGENKILGDWPGTKLEATDGVYNVTINAAEAPEFIIFNNGNGGEGNQTEDLAFENGKAYEFNKPVEPVSYNTTVTYALQAGDTFKSGKTVDVKNNDATVATITYGETGEGAADFKAAKADANVDGFVAFTEGNGVNGNKEMGTFYTIVPNYDGEIEIAVVLNADKAFYVLEDGTALSDYDGIKVGEKYYGTYTFNVTAGKSYKFYCAGSKLGFYGFNYKYNAETPEPEKIETMYIVGELTGGWPTEEGDWSMAKAMTQDTENEAVWTLTVEGFEAEAKTYYYKATANQKWGVYELPGAGANNDFVFGTDEYPAGKYDLLFTVNTDENTLTLVATKIGGTEGITTLKNAIENGTVYNMNGQKVNKAQKGLYIINGRKVVVK